MRKILAAFLFIVVAGAVSAAELLLSAEERAQYQKLLGSDKAAAESYRVTREYVAKAKAVVDGGGKGAADFPGKPKGFASKNLSADGKDKDAINAAVQFVIGSPTAPAAPGALSGESLPTAEERAKYKKLAATDKAEAESYLATRDYVRKAKAVVDGGGKGAKDFPSKPKGFGSRHLSADGKDKAAINAAVQLSIQAIAEGL